MKGCIGGIICFLIGMVIVFAAFYLGRASTSDQAKQSGKVTVDDLMKELGNAKESARKWAAEALGQKGEDAAPAVPNLTELLKDKSESVRKAAAEALEKIGPKAKEALPALEESLRDGASAVQEAARRAIDRIRGMGEKRAQPPPEAGADYEERTRDQKIPKASEHADHEDK